MKFRAKITSAATIQHFIKVLVSLAKLAPKCYLRLTPDNVYFIIPEGLTQDNICVWCELKQEHFFNDYQMEGVSQEHNEIVMSVIPENIIRVVKSAQSAKSLKIKLTKKLGASLTFEIELPSVSSGYCLMVHHVPIALVPRRLWDELLEPQMPVYDVSIALPSVMTLKTVVERMKSLSSFVVVAASKSGKFSLRIQEMQVTVSTTFKDLEVQHEDNGNQTQRAERTEAEAKVDFRKLAQLILGLQVVPSEIICNIRHGRTVHFFLISDSLVLQYFMPAISD